MKLHFFIIVVFPLDLLENGILAPTNFCVFVLEDIIIPGIFIAFLLRFDRRYVLELI